MRRQRWNVRAFRGRTGFVRLVDYGSGGWQHINFDDLRGNIRCESKFFSAQDVNSPFYNYLLIDLAWSEKIRGITPHPLPLPRLRLLRRLDRRRGQKSEGNAREQRARNKPLEKTISELL